MTTNTAEQVGRHIRRRARYLPGLPDFEPVAAAYRCAPCFDKMEVRRSYTLTGLDAISFDHPGELVRAMRDDRLRPSHRLPYLEDFIALTGYSDRRYNGAVSIRRNERAGGRVWLIGVKLSLSPVHDVGSASIESRPNDAPPIHVTATSEINPARLIAHAIKRGIDVETSAWHELLTSDEDTYRELCSSSYNGGDNIIPASAFLQPVSESHWVRLAVRCLEAVDELVHHLLVSDRPRDTPRLSFEPVLRPDDSLHIRSAEVHQEFRRLDASDTVRRLLPTLRLTASNLTQSLWTSEEEHSPVASYTLRLTDQINLGIYAKSHDRIRIEVRFHSRVPSRGALSLEERLMALASEANERVQSARRAIAAGQERLSQPVTLGEAIGRLSELSSELGRLFGNDRGRHRRLLEVLLTHGAVDAGRESVITSEEARRLVRLRVLDTTRIANRSRHANRYALTPEYALLIPLFELGVGIGRE